MGDTKTNEMIDLICDVLTQTHAQLDRLDRGPTSYYFGKVKTYVQALFNYSRYKVGDKVMLVRDVETNPSSGWYAYREWLVRGSPATVFSLDYESRDGYHGFVYNLTFDRETSGEDAHVFGFFREESLEPFSEITHAQLPLNLPAGPDRPRDSKR
jgi:hypothetical protein